MASGRSRSTTPMASSRPTTAAATASTTSPRPRTTTARSASRPSMIGRSDRPATTARRPQRPSNRPPCARRRANFSRSKCASRRWRIRPTSARLLVAGDVDAAVLRDAAATVDPVAPAASSSSLKRSGHHARAEIAPAGGRLVDKGSRASAGAHAHRAGNPDRPARRQAHRTGAIAASPLRSPGWDRSGRQCDRPDGHAQGPVSRSRLVPSLRDTSRTMSSEELGPAPGPTVLPRGPDRGLGVDELGSIRLVEDPAPAAA
jgi:hypothetical protein